MRRFDDELLSIAWMEIDEVRAKGRWGDFEVRCNREGKTIRVDRRLVALEDLRNTIRAKIGQ